IPKDPQTRKQWLIAIRREDFKASDSSKVCSQHFVDEDFDRTGQTVRLRAGVVPSVLNFPNHLQKVVNPRTSKTSLKAATPLEEVCRKKRKRPEEEPENSPLNDRTYAITSVDDLKKKNSALQARVDDLERQLRNTSLRETRAKKNLCSALEDLKEKNLLTEDLQSRLAIF
ncbi:hypothetical protein CAPTEDRAFT_76654, partial [Capitella teleta]